MQLGPPQACYVATSKIENDKSVFERKSQTAPRLA